MTSLNLFLQQFPVFLNVFKINFFFLTNQYYGIYINLNKLVFSILKYSNIFTYYLSHLMTICFMFKETKVTYSVAIYISVINLIC